MKNEDKKENNTKKSGRYTQQELVYIKVNHKNKTDKDIAESLGRPESGIVEQRKKMGLLKDIGRPKNQTPKLSSEEYYSSSDNTDIMRDLTPSQRKEFAIQLFNNSSDYKRLQKQFDEDEIDTYSDLFSDYLSEFQQLLPQEVQQVHILVTEQLIKDRFLRRIKMHDTMKIRIQELNERQTEIFMKEDRTSEDNVQIDALRTMIDDIKSNMDVVENLWKELDQSASRAERAFKALKFTREQRLKNQQEHGKTLVTVAQKLNDAKMREAEGEHIAIINKEMQDFKDNAKSKNYMMGDF